MQNIRSGYVVAAATDTANVVVCVFFLRISIGTCKMINQIDYIIPFIKRMMESK